MAARLRVRESVPMSATLAIHNEVRRLRAAGREVFHLGFGEATFPVHPKILEAFKRNATERTYLPVAGLPQLRETVAAYYRRRFDLAVEPDRVLVGCGSKSLLYAAMRSVDGDVVLSEPCWVTYEPQARLAGLGIQVVRTRFEDGYLLTPEALDEACDRQRREGSRPAAVVVSSPNNPTGVVYPPELVDELAAVARARGLIVISDEIYALTAYGAPRHRCFARAYPEGTIVTGGLSKHLSLGGWRLGVAVLPPGDVGERIAACMSGVAGAVWTTPASPVQHAAVAAYADDPEIDAYIAACGAIHGRITRSLFELVRSLEVPCVEPSGAFYLYPSFAPWAERLAADHEVTGCRELAALLLRKEQIATLPGADFGSDPRRLSLRFSTSQLHRLSNASVERIVELSASEVPDEEFEREVCPDLEPVRERLARFVASLGGARKAS